MKNILILNDFVCLGKIAGRLMSTVLSYMDYEVFFLPTSLIANNFSLGKNAFLNTNDFVEKSLKNWKDLNFKFDLIFVGFIEDEKQKDIIIDFINSLDYRPKIVFDPIMGDNGKLYESITADKISTYQSFLDIADITIPNQTEAKFLALDLDLFLDGKHNLIITSLSENGKNLIRLINTEITDISYEKVDVSPGGTGDLFDALFIGFYLKNMSIKEAIKKTSSSITKILKAQKELDPYPREIYVEKFFDLIESWQE